MNNACITSVFLFDILVWPLFPFLRWSMATKKIVKEKQASQDYLPAGSCECIRILDSPWENSFLVSSSSSSTYLSLWCCYIQDDLQKPRQRKKWPAKGQIFARVIIPSLSPTTLNIGSVKFCIGFLEWTSILNKHLSDTYSKYQTLWMVAVEAAHKIFEQFCC